MAICKMCHKSIPDGRDFCDECENIKNTQADESYLDSLLSSVSGGNEVKKKRTKKSTPSDEADISISVENQDLSEMLEEIIDDESIQTNLQEELDIFNEIMSDEIIPDEIMSDEIMSDEIISGIGFDSDDIADVQADDNIIPESFIEKDLAEELEAEIPMPDVISDSIPDVDTEEDTEAEIPMPDVISDSIPEVDTEEEREAEIPIPDAISDTIPDIDIAKEPEAESLIPNIAADSLFSENAETDDMPEGSFAQSGYEPADDMDELISSLFEETDENSKINTVTEPEAALEPDDIADIFEEAQAINEMKFTTEDGETINVDQDIDSLFEDISDAGVPGISDILGEDELEATMDSSNVNPVVDEPDLDKILDDINNGDFESGSSDNSNEGTVLEMNSEPKKKKVKKEKASKEKKKKEKDSLFKKLFANVKEERTPEQEEEYRRKLREEEEQKKAKAEQKKIKAQESKERSAEKKKLDKEEAAKKAKLKEEEKRRKKEAAKEKAKKKKEERLALEEYEVDEGRINRAGATILFVIFAILTVVIIVGTNIYSYNLSIENAQEEFDIKHYNDAYYEVYGLEIRDEDIELYDRIMTVMYVNTQLNSYEYYMKSGNREKALDSLLKGLQRYDKYLQLATILDIRDDLNYVKGNILSELKEEFGFSEDDAYDMIVINDSVDYSEYIYQLLGTYEEDIVE